MRLHHTTPPIAVLALLLLSGGRAAAAGPVNAQAGAARKAVSEKKPNGPTPMVVRGLVLPPRLIDVYVLPAIVQPIGTDPLRMALTVGAVWGVEPEMSVDVQLIPFYLPLGTPGPARITFTRRFVKTKPVDIGIGLMTTLDPSTPSFVGSLQPSVTAILRPHELLRIDTGAQLPLFTAADPHLGFRVPVSVFFQITDRIHFGSTSALFIADLRHPETTTSIPIGLTAGYSAGAELDFAAFTPFVSWTNFYTPATGAVDTRAFVAGIIADVAFELP